jgi:hypothetical protein
VNVKKFIQQEKFNISKETNNKIYFIDFIFNRQEVEKCRIDLQATEVQQYLKQEVQRREDIHRTELTHQQEK